MAVSMNANSGYRSDFMVGDNTYSGIPDNVGAQNSGNFSEILSGLGTSMASAAKGSASVKGSNQTARSEIQRMTKPTGSVNSSGSVKKADVLIKPDGSYDVSERSIVITVRNVSVSTSSESTLQSVQQVDDSFNVSVVGDVSGKDIENVDTSSEVPETLPMDDFELAEMLLSGKIDLNDIPAERLTPKFLKVLAIVAKLQKIQKEKDGEGDEDDLKPEEKQALQNNLFDPSEAVKLLQAFSELIDDQMTDAIYKILQDYQENKAEDAEKVTLLDGICKALPEFPELERALPFPISEEKKEEEPQDWIMQIIDQMIESIKAAQVEEQNQEAVSVELVNIVESVTNVQVTSFSDKVNSIPEQTVGFDDSVVNVDGQTNVFGGQEIAVPEQEVDASEQATVAAEQAVIVPEQATDLSEQAAVVPEQAAVVPEQAAAVNEQDVFVQDTQAEISASSGIDTAESSRALDGEKLTVLDNAVEKGEIEKIEVETVRTEAKESVRTADDLNTVQTVRLSSDHNAQKSDSRNNEDSSQQRGFTISEELEMLRNAKQKITVKSDNFTAKFEANPVRAENPLVSDTPIVFTRADGTEISVKPSEIVNQTAKLIEQAVTENKEQSEYSLVLNPEEMGRITVKLIKAADGAVTVTITAENARTQRLLETHSELMQNNLRSNGVDLESWQTVGESGHQHAAQDYQGSSKNPYYSEEHHNHNSDNNGDDNNSFADLIAAM